MVHHRRSQVHTSDDEDSTSSPPRRSTAGEDNTRRHKRVILFDEEEDESEMNEVKANEEEDDVDAQPIGDVIRVSGKGKETRKHYGAFEYDGVQYQLEDSVLLVPEQTSEQPYVAMIKDIFQTLKGDVMMTCQWFYRPEEAKKRGGGFWQRRHSRELYYSFHVDEEFAESVMHKCVVHFVPQNKKIPHRKQHQGFVVQKVYDTVEMRLFDLTDIDYRDNKQQEIDLLVEKTVSRIGNLPDDDDDDGDIVEDQMKNNRLLRKRNPGASEYNDILWNFKVLTGETQRDRWLEKLLLSIQCICTPGDKSGGGSNQLDEESRDKTQNGGVTFDWPDAAVPAIAALEKVVHDSFYGDFQKYNQKMRQLAFNLKSNGVLARRLLNRELEPVQLLFMTPNELKEGLTADEIDYEEPDESGFMQMTDAPCKRCKEKRVGVREIIQTGRGDRYQLECDGCGNTWYASRDEVTTITVDVASSATTCGTAPLATSKFADAEKILMSPRGESEASEKTTEVAHVPVLETN